MAPCYFTWHIYWRWWGGGGGYIHCKQWNTCTCRYRGAWGTCPSWPSGRPVNLLRLRRVKRGHNIIVNLIIELLLLLFVCAPDCCSQIEMLWIGSAGGEVGRGGGGGGGDPGVLEKCQCRRLTQKFKISSNYPNLQRSACFMQNSTRGGGGEGKRRGRGGGR